MSVALLAGSSRAWVTVPIDAEGWSARTGAGRVTVTVLSGSSVVRGVRQGVCFFSRQSKGWGVPPALQKNPRNKTAAFYSHLLWR
jgi:hypothetical protein